MLLNRHSVKPGDRVAVLSQNTIEYLSYYFAVQDGSVRCLIPGKFSFCHWEIEFILTDCSARLLIVQEQYLSMVTGMTAASVPSNRITMDDVSSAAHDTSLVSLPLPECAKFDDPCMILYTSGPPVDRKGL